MHSTNTTERRAATGPVEVAWPDVPVPRLPEGKLPVFYRKEYNITLWGVEKLHPFDSCKYEHVFEQLERAGVLTIDQVVAPPLLSDEELHSAHTPAYLASLNSSLNIARIAEVPPAAVIPACFLRPRVLEPMMYASKGTIIAAHFALQHGYAINFGGGFHHARRDRGHGFCFYNDISQAVWSVRKARGRKRIMIVDLDAHQGDGHENDLKGDPDVYIFDAFTPGIFPNDRSAMKFIRSIIYFRPGDTGPAFLEALRDQLTAALDEFHPELVIYNAGTDILAGDPLSGLSYTREAVIERDAIVYELCGFPRHHSAGEHEEARSASLGVKQSERAAPGSRPFVPVVYLFSGGYQAITANVIADSLANLSREFGLLKLQWAPPSSLR